MPSNLHPANRLARTLQRALHGDAGAGLLLIAVAAAAIAIANSPAHELYHAVFHGTLAWSPIPKLDTLHLWINDALMAVFFFVVGLEIKREVLDGELADPARRRLPVLAASAGHAEAQRGWAIPAATDIAFAVGVLGLIARRAPPSLRLFLLTVAIVDDLGAIVIIAVFYTASINLAWAAAAAGFLAALVALNRMRVSNVWLYFALGLGLWACVLYSGIHATIAGVLAAFTVPLRLDRHGNSLLLRLEHALTPWNSYVIVPLFGLANAGVSLAGLGLGSLLDPVPLGIALGLFAGKQAGILASLFAAKRLGFGQLPAGASWLHLWGMALLCGIGFTMSLFIAGLAFADRPELVEEAKLGILTGSILSALLGYAVLRLAPRPAA